MSFDGIGIKFLSCAAAFFLLTEAQAAVESVKTSVDADLEALEEATEPAEFLSLEDSLEDEIPLEARPSEPTETIKASTEASRTQRRILPQGMRVALLRPVLEQRLSCYTCNLHLEWPASLGVHLGYVKIDPQEVGYTTGFSYIAVQDDRFKDQGLVIAEVNLAYGFSSKWNIKAGPNVSDIIGQKRVGTFLAIGFQASTGYQITPSFGIDLGLTRYAQNVKEADELKELGWQGFDMRLHATF